jgi:hypothetical protein
MIDLENVETVLRGPNVRDRLSALSFLEGLPLETAETRDAILERAVAALLADDDLIALSSLLTMVQPVDVVDALVGSDDWLFRWTLLPWTNEDAISPFADEVRRRLAFDEHPLVFAEAHQHLMMLDEFAAANAGAQGVAMAVLSNHGPALAFRSVATAFMETWPAAKTTYDVEELRDFALRFSSQHE